MTCDGDALWWLRNHSDSVFVYVSMLSHFPPHAISSPCLLMVAIFLQDFLLLSNVSNDVGAISSRYLLIVLIFLQDYLEQTKVSKDVVVKLFVNHLPENCPVMRWGGGTPQKNNWTNSNTAVENSVEGVLSRKELRNFSISPSDTNNHKFKRS